MDVPLEILDREVARAEAELPPRPARASTEATSTSPRQPARGPPPRERARHRPRARRGPRRPRDALRAWVETLTLERVLWPDTVRRAAAWRAASITVAETDIVPLTESPRDLLVRTLREADPARRRVFAAALARGSGAVADAARLLAERRVEAARPARRRPRRAGDPRRSSRRRRRRRRAPARRHRAPPRSRRLLGGGARRRRGARVRRGVAGPPRHALALRSLQQGPAHRRASGPRSRCSPRPSARRRSPARWAAIDDGPRRRRRPPYLFALARPPFDLRCARRAALFAALVADPVFAARALGLGRGRARDQARGIARALLVALRVDAARVLCRGILSLPGGERDASFEQHTATALGAPIPPGLCGVVPRLGPDDPSRFAGALLAASDRREPGGALRRRLVREPARRPRPPRGGRHAAGSRSPPRPRRRARRGDRRPRGRARPARLALVQPPCSPEPADAAGPIR